MSIFKEGAWDNPASWTRGDPAAPPHVKDFWDTPDRDNIPDDANEKRYYWDVPTGQWLEQEEEPS